MHHIEEHGIVILDVPRPDPDTQNARMLWLKVLRHAIMDYRTRGSCRHRQNRKAKAGAWFRSGRRDIGSFLWICENLDQDPGHVLKRLDTMTLPDDLDD